MSKNSTEQQPPNTGKPKKDKLQNAQPAAPLPSAAKANDEMDTTEAKQDMSNEQADSIAPGGDGSSLSTILLGMDEQGDFGANLATTAYYVGKAAGSKLLGSNSNQETKTPLPDNKTNQGKNLSTMPDPSDPEDDLSNKGPKSSSN